MAVFRSRWVPLFCAGVEIRNLGGFSFMSEEMKARTARVVLVEDHPMFREQLGIMLVDSGEFTICGEADNIADAMSIIRLTNPDIAIVDVNLRGSSGLELIRKLKAEDLDPPVLILSMHDEGLYAESALRAGARGYISKHEAGSTLIEAIRKVISGEIYPGVQTGHSGS
ncbi:MAG: response regulator transcription factor [Chthoniobacteraceae bacterium]